MKHQQNTTFMKLIEIETAHATAGTLPCGDSLQEEMYFVQTKEQNAKKIHAMTLGVESQSVDPLTEIRAQIFKGNFVRANEIIERAKDQFDASVLSELLIQEAKLACYEWQWNKSLILINQALQVEKKLLSRMTLFQIRARANYELGLWRDAIQDLELFYSLAEVYPHSPSIIYAKGVHVRILARNLSITMAEQMLEDIWEQELKRVISADSLFTLLRLEIDVRRKQNESYLSRAVACKMIEAATGEGYFESLADIDISFASKELYEKYMSLVRVGAMKYVGIAQLVSEINGSSDSKVISSTARSMVLQEGVNKTTAGELDKMLGSKYIYIISRKILFSIDKLQTETLHAGSLATRLIEVLSKGPVRKSEIFSRIWGQKYSSKLHDVLLRNLFKRIRSRFNLEIVSVRGVVSMHGVHYVE